MEDKYYLLIGYNEEYERENINSYWVELRNSNRTDDENEKIIFSDVPTMSKAVRLAKKYIKKNKHIEKYVIE